MEIAQLARKACAACPEVTERDMINIVREIFNTMRQELVDAPEGRSSSCLWAPCTSFNVKSTTSKPESVSWAAGSILYSKTEV
ncbi:hypothetical protein [Ideonella paludis]|uniref:hypothetical protein n=1 Tax=Ideonella paludis TaxID=1233411 RepID=UPI003641325E